MMGSVQYKNSENFPGDSPASHQSSPRPRESPAVNRNAAKMFFWKALVLTVSTASLGTAAVLDSSHTGIKRSEGTVPGAEDGTSYHFNSTGTSEQCPGLSVADLESSLARFDPLFPPQSVHSHCRGLSSAKELSTKPSAGTVLVHAMRVRRSSVSAPCISTRPRASKAFTSHMKQ